MFGPGRAKRIAAPVLHRVAAIGLALALAACGGGTHEKFQRAPEASRQEVSDRQNGSVLGKDTNLFSTSKAEGTPEVAVNAFLWRATLDTIAFMPLASADPFGGIIITDWYSLPESPQERFKLNVYILGKALRADGLKVSVFRQIQDSSGRWTDAVVGAEVAPEFEDAVLSRARQLRLEAVNEKS
jgi:hypothetical protein